MRDFCEELGQKGEVMLKLKKLKAEADAKKALEHFVAARDCFPRDANLHRRVVKAAEAAGEEALARQAREAIIAIDPTDIQTRMEMISWWKADEQHEKIVAELPEPEPMEEICTAGGRGDPVEVVGLYPLNPFPE